MAFVTRVRTVPGARAVQIDEHVYVLRRTHPPVVSHGVAQQPLPGRSPEHARAGANSAWISRIEYMEVFSPGVSVGALESGGVSVTGVSRGVRWSRVGFHEESCCPRTPRDHLSCDPRRPPRNRGPRVALAAGPPGPP